ENEKLLKYGDTKSARNIMYTVLQKLIEGNPLMYKVLNILEFNSTRQNMPIIVHDKDGKL
ncbi:hypothetical protein IGI04_011365, partial [Brassica rapa subsp. trilocularis]